MSTEYVPATYTNVLDRMLARGARPGQGGHLEGNAEEVMAAVIRLAASCWAFLVTEIVNVLGMESAETMVVNIARCQGGYRGTLIRRELESRGLPLDVAHAMNYWNGGSLGEQGYLPHYGEWHEPGCPMYDQWSQLAPQALTFLQCQESHRSVAREINPAIQVSFPALLTRGQPECVIRFSMTVEQAEEAARQAERLRQEATKAGRTLAGEREPWGDDPARYYGTFAALNALYFHCTANELLAAGEEQRENILRRAMRKWGAWRGNTMAEDHQKRGWPLDVQTLITYFDDPAAGDAWLAENVTLSPSEHTKDIVKSAYTARFEEIGTGGIAAIMFEEALPAQAKAYNPKIELSLPMLMERGDSVTRLSYSMSD